MVAIPETHQETAMKSLLIMSILFSSTLAFAMPKGTFNGTGQWESSDGKNGTYTVTTTFDANRFHSSYNYDGKEVQYDFSVQITNKGSFSESFDVLFSNQKIGSGYCLSKQCHYQTSFAGLEETLTFHENFLYKMGSKDTGNGTTVMWQEKLEQ
jgi:hypothetical protein